MKEKILIVDDKFTDKSQVENMLKEYDVISAKNEKGIWKILAKEHPDLILLDVMTQDENDLQIVKELSQNEISKNIPIILITAKDINNNTQNNFDFGDFNYIKKPFDKTELKTKIKSALQNKQIKSESIGVPLTNILSRRYFFNIAKEQLEYSKKSKNDLSIALINIDFLKKINNYNSNMTSNFILEKLTSILQDNIRVYDLVAKYSEKKFVILFIDCNKKISNKILERIKNNVENTGLNLENFIMQFSLSYGLSDVKDPSLAEDITTEDLIKIAYDRLNISKSYSRKKISTYSA
ncbi:MAG: diguanylate cyclase [Spirochaetes bacterium]|nr:diguanylate cyclase [Spirochaetota bacterium]